MNKNRKLVMFIGIILLFIAISGCSNYESTDNYQYYFSLMGEGEKWIVKSYQIEISPESVKAGNGEITMKGNSEYTTDSYNIRVFAVYDDKEKVIQGNSITGNADLDIAQLSTGTIESSDGKYLSPDKINNIYMEIEWKDLESEQWLKDRIDLFNKDTLLN